MRLRGRLLAGAAAAAALCSVAGFPAADPVRATTAEVYPVPPGGVYVIDGHGWGHGVGLSQWGAEGGAQSGASAAQILGHYYPGTAASSIGEPTIRVVLTEAGTEGYPGWSGYAYQCDAASSTPTVACTLDVLPASGLYVEDLATGAKELLPGGATRWRAAVDTYGHLHLSELTSTGWHVVALGGRTTLSGPVRFFGPALVQVRYHDGSVNGYRGAVQAVHTAGTRMARVLVSPMDSYLYGVVPRESPSSWLAAALQAQAVAARTYAQYDRLHAGTAPWDICDSDYCQVFEGSTLTPPGGSTLQLEASSTNQAVDATKGVIRTYGGAPIVAMYSSSNGGWSVAGNAAYLPAAADPWDAVASPVHDWTAHLSAAEIEAAYPAVGQLRAVVVTQRDGNGDWGGRVLSVTLQGVSSSGQPTSVAATGSGLYWAHPWPEWADGLLSNWWTVDPSSYPPVMRAGVPVAAVWSTGAALDEFDATTANQVEWRRWTLSGWSRPTQLDGKVTSGPAAAVYGLGEPALFALSATGEPMTRTLSTSGAWTSWRLLGGAATAPPAAVTVGSGVIDLFVRGTDGAVHMDTVRPTGASGWSSLGGAVMSGTGPAAVSVAAGKVQVFIEATNAVLYEDSFDGTRWSGWVRLGRTVASAPSAAADSGSAYVFVRGTDGTVWTAHQTAGTWSTWTSLARTLVAAPSSAGKSGRVDVFVWGSDGKLYHAYLASAWSAWSPPF